MRVRPRLRYFVALVLLATAVLVYSRRPEPIETGELVPIIKPIELRVGRIDGPEFTAARSATYYLFIEAEDKIGRRLSYLLGMFPEPIA